MQTSKISVMICAAAICASPLFVRADDTEAQAKMRAALHQKMNELKAQEQTNAPVVVAPKKVAKPAKPAEPVVAPVTKPAPPKMVVQEKPVKAPVVEAVKAPKTYGESAPAVSMTPTVLKESDMPPAVVKTKPAPVEPKPVVVKPVPVKPVVVEKPVVPAKPVVVVEKPKAPVAPVEPKPVVPAHPVVVVEKPKAPVAPVVETPVVTEVKPVVDTSRAAAEKEALKLAAEKEKAAKKAKASVKTGETVQSVVNPDLPLSADKQTRLNALLEQYKADKLTPVEYHEQRAKIIAEP